MGEVVDLGTVRRDKIREDLNCLQAKAYRLGRKKVSTYDILQVFELRDRTEETRNNLSFQQLDQLERIDRLLLSYRELIVKNLDRTICLRRNQPRSRWWWYLHELNETGF